MVSRNETLYAINTHDPQIRLPDKRNAYLDEDIMGTMTHTRYTIWRIFNEYLVILGENPKINEDFGSGLITKEDSRIFVFY